MQENIISFNLPDESGTVNLIEYVNIPNREMGRRYRPAVIVCPGGAYGRLSKREADSVAIRFEAYGMQAFVLRYSTRKLFPTALKELASAIAYIRKNADKYDIDCNKINICGFSAGGHLAAMLGTCWNSFDWSDIEEKAKNVRPNKLILCYPLITSGQYAHEESINNLIGNNGNIELRKLVSIEEHITSDMPPVFVWHNIDDDLVPVENSLLLIQQLRKAGIKFEAHLLPEGGHGLALADDCTAEAENQIKYHCSEWFGWALQWIKSQE